MGRSTARGHQKPLPGAGRGIMHGYLWVCSCGSAAVSWGQTCLIWCPVSPVRGFQQQKLRWIWTMSAEEEKGSADVLFFLHQKCKWTILHLKAFVLLWAVQLKKWHRFAFWERTEAGRRPCIPLSELLCCVSDVQLLAVAWNSEASVWVCLFVIAQQIWRACKVNSQSRIPAADWLQLAFYSLTMIFSPKHTHTPRHFYTHTKQKKWCTGGGGRLGSDENRVRKKSKKCWTHEEKMFND